MDPLAGYQLQSYRLLHQVGSGGMGAVYKAEHRQNHAHYAIKILHPAYSQDEVMVERLRREAMLASQLQHHNIVQIYDHGWDTNVGFYMVMELLVGRGLDQLIEQEPILPVSRVAGVVYQVCDALEVAHSVGVIHRDLKPANVFLMRSAEGYELVKLVDFGIARIENAKGQALTQMGKHFGTPEYMPPEQILAQRENMGPATDLYSLAVLIFKMLTGRLPFVSKSLVGMMNLVMFRSPPPLSKLQPRFHNTQLERLLFQCMAKKPENRVQDIATFRHRFWEAIEQDPLMRPMLDTHHQRLWKLHDYEPLPDDSIGYGEDTDHGNTTDHSLENGMLEDGQSFQFGDDEYQIQGDEIVSATAVHPAFSTMLDDDDDCPTMINRSVTPGHSPHHLSVAEDEQQDGWAAALLHRDETFDEGDPTLIPTSTNHLKMTKPVGSSPLAAETAAVEAMTMADSGFSYQEVAKARGLEPFDTKSTQEEPVQSDTPKHAHGLLWVGVFVFVSLVVGVAFMVWPSQEVILQPASGWKVSVTSGQPERGLFRLLIVTKPPGAEVVVQGKRLGRTPLVLTRPKGTQIDFVVTKDHYEMAVGSWKGIDSREMRMVLLPRGGPKPRR